MITSKVCWRWHLSFGPGFGEKRSSLHVRTQMHYSIFCVFLLEKTKDSLYKYSMFCISSPRLVVTAPVHKTNERIMYTQDHLHTHLCKLLKAIQRASQISANQWEVCTSHMSQKNTDHTADLLNWCSRYSIRKSRH